MNDIIALLIISILSSITCIICIIYGIFVISRQIKNVPRETLNQNVDNSSKNVDNLLITPNSVILMTEERERRLMERDRDSVPEQEEW
jgi:hypothetical protein